VEAHVKNLFLILSASVFIFGCKKATDDAATADIEDTAQQIGDIMASADEAGGTSGSLASLDKYKFQKTFDRLDETKSSVAANMATAIFTTAEAVTCEASGTGYGFGSCNAGARTITRSFNNCTVGTAVISGDVTLTWSGSAPSSGCTLGGGSPVAGDAITRVPNFMVTGRRGATLTVSKSGSVGQKIAYVNGTSPNMVFNFTNDGIRRKFTTPSNAVLFDQTTTVASGTPIVITGNSRSNRKMDTGFLTVTNNLSNVVCNYTPSNVTWNSTTCNCPTQGSWTGSCSNGKSATLLINGCGTGKYTEGDTSSDVIFDRCGT